MTLPRHLFYAVFAVLAGVSPAWSQPPTEAAAPPAKTPLLGFVDRFRQPDQGGGYHVSPHFAVVFGDIKPGSSIALGPAVSETFADGSFVQAKAEYSIRQFKLLQLRYDSRKLAGGRVVISSRVRWQDAPKIPLFALGPHATKARADYGERKTELSVGAEAQLLPRLRGVAGFGVERYGITSGTIDTAEDEALPAVPDVPGLGTRPWFTHAIAGLAYDSRPAGQPRSGELLEATVHDYRDRHDGSASFQLLETSAEQLLPTGPRGVLDLSVHLWTTHAAAGRFVPFYLMPTLGGGDYMEAFRLYRFRDRDAMVLAGEYPLAGSPDDRRRCGLRGGESRAPSRRSRSARART